MLNPELRNELESFFLHLYQNTLFCGVFCICGDLNGIEYHDLRAIAIVAAVFSDSEFQMYG